MSLELNKIAASVLTAGVVAMGSGFIADLLIHPEAPDEPVYKVASKQDTGGGGGDKPSKPAGPEPIKPLLADADPEAGRSAMQACAACHSFEQGGPNKVGPNLYGVLGNDIASHEGFGYSSALSGKEGAWTYEKMNAYLANPQEWAPGTNMSYPGIKDAQKRANVVAWLRQNDDDPMALPTAEEVAQAEQAAGGDQAEGEQAEGEQAEGEQTAKAAGDGGEAAGGALGKRLANASASAGKSASQVCVACHSFEQGGPNKVGPNLYDVVGTDIASHEGYSYSDALKGKDGVWTWAKLDAYLENPNKWAPGNKMTYPGVKDDAKRADVLMYLAEHSEDPPALPGAAASGDGGDQTAEGDGQTADQADQQTADDGGQQAGEQDTQQTGGTDQAEATEAEKTQQAEATEAGETQQAEASEAGESAAADGGNPLHKKIAAADPSAGKSASQICVACHSFEQGGPNKVGPNLYDVIGADIASHDGYSYSDALKGKDGAWTYAKLDKYLENPNQWAPGNKMTYPGVKDDAKRAAVIAYMRQFADNPPELNTGGGEQKSDAGAGSAGDGQATAGDGGGGDQATADEAGDGETQAASGEDEGDTGETQQAEATGGGESGGGPSDPLLKQIAAADPSTGKSASQICVACHSFEQGGPNKVGPNLYDVIGADIASHDGYSYSDALKGKDGAWTYAKLDKYLENPNQWAPGNKMTYPGVKDDAKRAAVIAYMRQFADNPPPLE